jgi:hypothetical protein
MEKLQKAMTLYVQALAKRKEADDHDKLLPVGYLGATMIGHGQDFQMDSEFGSCLISMFRNRRVPGWQDADRIFRHWPCKRVNRTETRDICRQRYYHLA